MDLIHEDELTWAGEGMWGAWMVGEPPTWGAGLEKGLLDA